MTSLLHPAPQRRLPSWFGASSASVFKNPKSVPVATVTKKRVETPRADTMVFAEGTSAIAVNARLNEVGMAAVCLPFSDTLRAALAQTVRLFGANNDWLQEAYRVPSALWTDNEVRYPQKLTLPEGVVIPNDGMAPEYETAVQRELWTLPIVRELLLGTRAEPTPYLQGGHPQPQIMPNRWRLQLQPGRCDEQFAASAPSLHIEGGRNAVFDVDEETGKVSFVRDGRAEMASFVVFGGKRALVYWDLTGRDLKPLYDVWHAANRPFVTLDHEWMAKTYPGCRRVIKVDATAGPVLVMWHENTPHEVTQAVDANYTFYLSPGGYRMCNAEKPVFVPGHAGQAGAYTAQIGRLPRELMALSAVYGVHGGLWPSDKPCYVVHGRAIARWLPDSVDPSAGPDNYPWKRLPQHGTVNQHDPAYRARLRAAGFDLPEFLFAADMPPFVHDPLTFPRVYCVLAGLVV